MSSPEHTPHTTPQTTPTKGPYAPAMALSSNTPPPSPGSPRPSLDRSSTGSSSSRSSLAGGERTTRRRGFMRPQGTEFSTSARSRDSVMALGSIAHLQYFFAKTGLLDGKGGGLKAKKSSTSLTVDTKSEGPRDSTYSSLRSTPELLLSGDQEFLIESPEGGMDDYDFDDSIMLPPTTSTYNPHTKQLPPAPDPDVLRKQLRNSLAITKRTWEKNGIPVVEEELGSSKEVYEGYPEFRGTELVDLATSAIRAAKSYYYTTDISLLTSKDDKTLREEFLAILDVLKRMAQRKFEGGVKVEEREALLSWITGVEGALCEEEKAIAELRSKGRSWLEGSWEGRECELNHLFLSYFDGYDDPLPSHAPLTIDTFLPTPFLAALQSGLRLIMIHNAVVRRSKRPFGQIQKYHTEFSKPYRLSENLRFWKKAAEIRWEVRLKFDVMAVVNGTEEGWRAFERDIAIWCHKVLQEVRQDWEMGEGAAAVGQQHQVRSARSATMASAASLKVEVGDQRI